MWIVRAARQFVLQAFCCPETPLHAVSPEAPAKMWTGKVGHTNVGDVRVRRGYQLKSKVNPSEATRGQGWRMNTEYCSSIPEVLWSVSQI